MANSAGLMSPRQALESREVRAVWWPTHADKPCGSAQDVHGRGLLSDDQDCRTHRLTVQWHRQQGVASPMFTPWTQLEGIPGAVRILARMAAGF
jgi:hypothetical protein